MVRIYLHLGKTAITVDWNLNRQKDWTRQKLNKHIQNGVSCTQVYENLFIFSIRDRNFRYIMNILIYFYNIFQKEA